ATWRAANPEEARRRPRESRRRHPQTSQRYHAEHYAANSVAHKEQVRRWRKEHPEEARAASRKRRALKAGVINTLTAQEWRETLEYFNYACAYCLRDDVPM